MSLTLTISACNLCILPPVFGYMLPTSSFSGRGNPRRKLRCRKGNGEPLPDSCFLLKFRILCTHHPLSETSSKAQFEHTASSRGQTIMAQALARWWYVRRVGSDAFMTLGNLAKQMRRSERRRCVQAARGCEQEGTSGRLGC